jgi:hypothetical protein
MLTYCKIITLLIAAHIICDIVCIIPIGSLGGKKIFSNAVIVIAAVICTIKLDFAFLKIFFLKPHLNNFRSASCM